MTVRVTDEVQRLPSWITVVPFAPPPDERRRAEKPSGWLMERGVVEAHSITSGGAFIIASGGKQKTWAEFGYASQGLPRDSVATIASAIESKDLAVVVISSQKDPLHRKNPREPAVEDVVLQQFAEMGFSPRISLVFPRHECFDVFLSDTGGLLRVNIVPYYPISHARA